MNRKQKICLWIGISIFVLMGLYPPWRIEAMGAGYDFILSQSKVKYRVDLPRLYSQWIVVAVIATGFIITFKDKKPKDD